MNVLRFLLLEDNPLDAEVVRITLAEGGIDCDIQVVDTRIKFVAALETGVFDLVLADYALPGFDGYTALKLTRALRPDVPFIFVSASLGEELAIESLKMGATDYVLKQRLERLVPCVKRALREAQDHRDRTAAEAALRDSEAKYRSLFESIDQGYFLVDVIVDENDQPVDLLYLETNPAATQIVGQDFTGQRLSEIHPDHEQYWFDIFGRVLRTGQGERLERYVETCQKWYDFYTFKVGDSSSKQIAIVFQDVTGRKRREVNAAFLNEVSTDFAHLSTSDEIMQTIGAKIGAFLNLPYCHFMSIDEERDEVVCLDRWNADHVPRLPDRIRLSEQVSAEFYSLMHTRQTVVSNDTHTNPITNAVANAAIQVRSFITVPFHQDGEWKYLFAVHDIQPRHWHQDEVELVQELANRMFPRLERARAEAALRESEVRFKGFAENNKDVIWITDAHHYQLVYVSPSFEQVWGRPATELYEDLSRFAEFIHPDDRDRTQFSWQQCHQDTFSQEYRILHPDETVVWIRDRCFPIYDDQGNLLWIGGIAEDISDRKQAEATITADLHDTQRLHDLSLKLTTEDDVQVLYNEIVTAAIALTRADAGTLQILDEANQELILLAAQGFDQLMRDHFQRVNTRSNTACRTALKSGQRFFIEFDSSESDDPDGSLQMHLNAGYLSAQSTPLINRSGRLIGMVSTHWRNHYQPTERELRFLDLLARQATDLIEQRQVELERQQLLEREQAARKEAEQTNQMKDEFLAILSHELRSPLNPILGWARLLQARKMDETKLQQGLSTIERNVRLQTQLIDDLLDVAKILRGKLKLDASSVNLTTVIRSAIEVVKTAAEAKSISIQTEFKDNCHIQGDEARLQQIVWNLLSNAVKFTPNSGRIEVQLERIMSDGTKGSGRSNPPNAPSPEHPSADHPFSSPTYAQLTVTDTGRGINPDFLPYIFQSFRQADASTTRQYGGLGLGLSIVKHLVDAHGGVITAHSPGDNQGATFTVRFPLLTDHAAQRETLSPAASPDLDLTGTKVLAVDDLEDARQLLDLLLTQYGAEVRVVTSGEEVLTNLEIFKPDVLVCDIGMPHMDGYSLIDEIRHLSAEQGGDVPAIALTAYVRDEDAQRALEHGFQKHMAKPLEPEDLALAIAELTSNP